MILNDTTISFYAERLIRPFVPEQVQPASYDLTLSNYFVRFDDSTDDPIDMASPPDDGTQVYVETEDGFILQPGEFALGCTEEIITIPADLVARLEGKSTIGRMGLLIHVTAGFVDPGWHGRLTLEIYNLRQRAIMLRPGKQICQIAFTQLSGTADKPYEGRYQYDANVSTAKVGV